MHEFNLCKVLHREMKVYELDSFTETCHKV